MKRMSFSAEQWMSIHGIEKAIKRLKVNPQGKAHLVLCAIRRCSLPARGDASIPALLYTTPAPTRFFDKISLEEAFGE